MTKQMVWSESNGRVDAVPKLLRFYVGRSYIKYTSFLYSKFFRVPKLSQKYYENSLIIIMQKTPTSKGN